MICHQTGGPITGWAYKWEGLISYNRDFTAIWSENDYELCVTLDTNSNYSSGSQLHCFHLLWQMNI